MSNNCTIASSFISFDLKVLLQAQLLREHPNNIFQKLQYGMENKPASNEI